MNYRIWDSEDKIFIYPFSVTFTNGVLDWFLCGSGSDIQKHREKYRFHANMSTGIKDSNGVEIYEGDIIESGGEEGRETGSMISIEEVCFGEYEGSDFPTVGFFYKYINMLNVSVGSSYVEHVGYIEVFHGSIDEIAEIKVIGNKYQNPELYGVKSDN